MSSQGRDKAFIQSYKPTNLLSSWRIFQDIALSSGSILYYLPSHSTL